MHRQCPVARLPTNAQPDRALQAPAKRLGGSWLPTRHVHPAYIGRDMWRPGSPKKQVAGCTSSVCAVMHPPQPVSSLPGTPCSRRLPCRSTK